MNLKVIVKIFPKDAIKSYVDISSALLIEFIEEVEINSVNLEAVKIKYWNPLDILNPICHSLQGDLNERKHFMVVLMNSMVSTSKLVYDAHGDINDVTC